MQDIEFNLNRTARRVHNLFKLTNFYDQMDFDPNQHLATSKAPIELTYILGDSNSELTIWSLHMNAKCEDTAIFFCREDK